MFKRIKELKSDTSYVHKPLLAEYRSAQANRGRQRNIINFGSLRRSRLQRFMKDRAHMHESTHTHPYTESLSALHSYSGEINHGTVSGE